MTAHHAGSTVRGARRTPAPRRFGASCAAVLLAVCALVLVPSGAASAHPLGNFTVNRYDGLVAAPGLLRIDHVEDLAEIPATQAEPQIKQSGMADWARQRCEIAARGSEITVDGRRAVPTAGASRAVQRPGQAGLRTLRVECRLTVPLPQGRTVSVAFRSDRPDSGPGWREITARGDGMTLTSRDVPENSVSHELTRYPEELLSSPADTATALLRVRPGGPALADTGRDAPASSVLPRGADRWTQALDGLVARRDLTPGFAVLALAAAVALGALHALAPGHGKTLMAAAAAARRRATLRDVLPLAASVTVTHTLGVVALGLPIAAGSAAAPSVIGWLGVTSGILVTLAGAGLVRRAWHNRGHGHAHHHQHAHDNSHDHAHTHGGHTHTHPTAPTVRGTILLGFAGGLVPSPSAVVVLVGASALGQAWFGVLLVVAYGAGLALTLTAAGFAVVKAGGRVARLLDRPPRWIGGRSAALIKRAVPLGSAFAVVALGAGLVLREASSVLG
ncbi:nickel transporter [Streptomyces sp. NBC_01217]|uniref:nickel transporter n=1 Tax=Streptomyces sp. NBC_01217 TaxID=2903779 RepID=UPI002E0F0AFF|nr:nickel transporter [Streptomyces sp. NBC_01217]